MDCHAVLEDVNNYLDRQVDQSVAEQIEVHLSCCPNCRIVYDTVAKTIRLYCEQRMEVPEGVRQRIRRALKAAVTGSAGSSGIEGESGQGFTLVRRSANDAVALSGRVEAYCEARQLPAQLRDRIASRAYELFEERGRVAGHELEDWIKAEAEILGSENSGSEPTKS